MAEVSIPDIGLTTVLNHLTSGLYMAVGSDATEGAVSDTTIAGEITRQLISVNTVTSAQKVQWSSYFSSATVSGRTIRKVAVFDASSGGNMLCQKLVTLVVPTGQGAQVVVNYPIARV